MLFKNKQLCAIFMLLFSISLFSQDKAKCAAIFKKVVKAIDDNDYKHFQPHLASNFTIAGQQGYVANMILEQLFPQMNEKVESYKKIEERLNNDILELHYSVLYKNVGERKTIVKFNSENEIVELSLSETMQVKTMSGESEIHSEIENEIIIPFKQTGNLMIVQVFLNGNLRPFLVDSGSPRLVLNSAHIKDTNSNQRVNAISNSRGVNGTISEMNISKVDTLNWAGMTLANEDVLTMNLSHLEEELDSEVYGLIGYDMLKNYDVLLNYSKKEVVLIKPDYFETYMSKELKGKDLERISFSLKRHIPILTSKIKNKTYKLALDTGAETNLLDDNLYSSLKTQLFDQQTESLIGADKNPKEVITGKLKELFIEDNEFNNLITVFSDISHFNSGYNLNVDGIIGYQVLSKYITIISYNRNELIFVK